MVDITHYFTCPICLQLVREPKCCPSCPKKFCSECIQSWLNVKPSCPMCRKETQYENFFSNPHFNAMIKLAESFPYTCSSHNNLMLDYCNTCEALLCFKSSKICEFSGHDVVAYDAKYEALLKRYEAETGSTFEERMFHCDFIKYFDQILANEKARLQKPSQ